MINAVFTDRSMGDQLRQLVTPPSDCHLQRSQDELLSLPKLAFQLGRLGIQLGVARSGVGRFSLGNDQYLIEAFGDAFVLWRHNGHPKVFWSIVAAVDWAKASRRLTANRSKPAPRLEDCG
jgi:hypothetical protein